MGRVLWTRVNTEIAKMTQKIAETKGITLSEYIRQLIIDDLDRRSVFNTRLRVNEENHPNETRSE